MSASPAATDTYFLLGILLRFLSRGAESGQAYCLVEALVAPGAGPPLNRHAQDDEAFYVLDGSFEFQRTVSRLEEMRSAEYLAQGHGIAS